MYSYIGIQRVKYIELYLPGCTPELIKGAVTYMETLVAEHKWDGATNTLCEFPAWNIALFTC